MDTTHEQNPVVVSAIRATGNLHIGNYFGAIRYFQEYQDKPNHRCFYFIANLHSLTTEFDPNVMKREIYNIVKTFIACGIDPTKSTIFAQSSVPETCELSWLLSCLTPLNDLSTMPHFQEKREQLRRKLGLDASDETSKTEKDTTNAGLLTYPVLMAADILGPLGTIVPVGNDQLPHVELTRELARRFNRQFGEFFPLPVGSVGDNIRVPSLTGDGKMGKSEASGTIALGDNEQTIQERFRPAPTDPNRVRRSDPGNPSNCKIFTYHHLVSSATEIGWAQDGCMNAKIGCVECKKVAAHNLATILAPVREKLHDMKSVSDHDIDDILHTGGLKAREVIADTVEKVKEMMGVRKF
jgi:tryptophanyl-tRNA synthetase